MLDKFLSAVFDQEHQFNDIWELKLIKFDTDLSNDLKPYQKHIGASDLIEDTKGNPGIKGYFYLSNLRIVWYSQADKDINLSIGLDTINNVVIKSTPVSGYREFKHVLILKAISPNQTKYQFKFSGFTQSQQKLFKKINDVFKKFSQTKSFRNIDTSIKLVNSQFVPLENEQIKTLYQQCILQQNQIKKQVTIIITNIRLVIVHDKNIGVNYGIPWIMIEGFSKINRNSRDSLQIKIRGLLKNVEFFVTCSQRLQFTKLHSQTYNKNPLLGVDFSKLDSQSNRNIPNFLKQSEVLQIEHTKVNIGRRKNAYSSDNQKGSIADTFFNEQLGLMMQKMPEGCSRKDYWQILRA